MKKFFVGCNLDFEHELVEEISEVWPYLINLDGKPHHEPLNILEVDQGGVTIENSFHLGLQLNYFLKIPNRILVRIGEKKVRDFPSLFQFFTRIKADPLLQGKKCQLTVSSKKSRVAIEKRIEETFFKVFQASDDSDQNSLKVQVRIYDDLCTLSIDTSGDHLHQRSQKDVGEAPLRETIASFCLRKLIKDIPLAELEQAILVDPMCGSGTFLFEGHRLYMPRFSERFSFLSLAQCPKIFKSDSFFANFEKFPHLFSEIWGFDRDANVLKICEDQKKALDSNLEKFNFEISDLSETLQVFNQQTRYKLNESKKTLVVANIPFGQRIKLSVNPKDILSNLYTRFKPFKVGILMARDQLSLFETHLETSDFTKEDIYGFKHGGLAVVFLTLRARSD